MNSTNNLNDIINTAYSNKWPFPKIFKHLKQHGVVSYNVSWLNGYKAEFKLSNNTINRHNLDEFVQPDIYCMFSKNKADDALYNHQIGNTNYVEWLHQMSDAGISEYIVNIEDNTVTYYSVGRADFHIEVIPSF